MTTTNAPAAKNGRVLQPRSRVHRKGDALHLEIVLPGVKREDVELQAERGVLRVQARGFHPESREGEQLVQREFDWVDWAASYRLPRDVDADSIHARMEHGVLTLELVPRTNPVTKIAVSAS